MSNMYFLQGATTRFPRWKHFLLPTESNREHVTQPSQSSHSMPLLASDWLRDRHGAKPGP